MLKIQIERSGLATIGKRGFQVAGRAAIEVTARYWFDNYLPLHFQNIAYRRYRYLRRDNKYNQRKARKTAFEGEDGVAAVGEVKPLVFTGRSRERSLSAPKIRAKAPNYQTYRADVIIDAPAFNFGVGKRINMRDEVTRFTPQEEKTMERVFVVEWNKQLKSMGLRAPRVRRRSA
jgi:hypothetical protein